MKSLIKAIAALVLVTLAIYVLLPPSSEETESTIIQLRVPGPPGAGDGEARGRNPVSPADTDENSAVHRDETSPEQAADVPPLQADETAAAEKGTDWAEYEVKPGDSMARVFGEFELDPAVLARVLASGPEAKRLADLRPGQLLRIRRDDSGALAELVHERSLAETLRVAAADDGFVATLEKKPVEVRTHAAASVIGSSLFADGQSAGLSDRVIMQLAEVFNWDVDFARELQDGDRFSLIYEASYVDGEKIRDGAILAAEFVNKGKTYRAVRYRDPDGTVDYYNPDGSAKRKAFIKTPVEFSRISSRFTNKRWHPVLNRWRSHRGVDYAAPTGTPVRAAGRGSVDFVGRQRGYGKVVFVQHGDRYTTVYGHLSRFARGLKKGDTVQQGEVIGYVGQTGLATGPHLHYEFRVNGRHVDPLSHKLPTTIPLPKRYMADFRRQAEPLVEQLNLLSAPRLAEKH